MIIFATTIVQEIIFPTNGVLWNHANPIIKKSVKYFELLGLVSGILHFLWFLTRGGCQGRSKKIISVNFFSSAKKKGCLKIDKEAIFEVRFHFWGVSYIPCFRFPHLSPFYPARKNGLFCLQIPIIQKISHFSNFWVSLEKK